MNLVSYEYVACQASKKGVLILSEVSLCSLPPEKLYGYYISRKIDGIKVVGMVYML